MTTAATAMRLAFEKAMSAPAHRSPATGLVREALRRKVGLTTRKVLWSVARGKR